MTAPSRRPGPKDVLAVWRESRRLHRASGESLEKARRLWSQFEEAGPPNCGGEAGEPPDGSELARVLGLCEHELSVGLKRLAYAMLKGARRPTETNLKEIRYREMDLAMAYMIYEWAKAAAMDKESRRLCACLNKMRDVLLYYAE